MKKNKRSNLFGVKKKPCDRVGNGTGKRYPPQAQCQRKVIKPVFIEPGITPDGIEREKPWSDPYIWEQIRALYSTEWVPGTKLRVSAGDRPWIKCSNGLRHLRPGDGCKEQSILSGRTNRNKDHGKSGYDNKLDVEGKAQFSADFEHRLNKAGR